MLSTAFISYSGRYREWVRPLYNNLSRFLGSNSVFLDEASLGPGHSWVSGLQRGIDRAKRVVLVASPEAFASPWVRHELERFQASRPDWKAEGLIHVALLVETPLPPFLASAQHVDFRNHDEASYRESLTALVAALRGLHNPRDSSPLPENLEVPEPPSFELPIELRGRLVRLLSPLVEPRYARTALATGLGLPAASLEDHASAPLAASAALVLAPDGESSIDKARRVLEVILDQELAGGEPGLPEELRALQKELAELAPAHQVEASIGRRLPKPAALVHPTGTVPLGSKLYVVRESDAAAACELTQSPALVHILGRRQSGKSSLIVRLTDEARKDPTGPLVVSINFQDFDVDTLVELRSLLLQITWQVLAAAGRDPETARKLERTPLSVKLACKRLIQSEVLERHSRGLLIAFDETDRVVRPGGCADDFFSMLRAWNEAGKHEENWSRLRLALSFSTESFLMQEGLTASPLNNVGLKCRLRDFNKGQIAWLVSRHGLALTDDIIRRIHELLGGNPYLIRRCLYALAVEAYDFEQIITEALSGGGPLGNHLARHLRHLQALPELATAMRRVLRFEECPEEQQYLNLENLGLVRRDGTRVMTRYRLYQDFLRAHLE